MKVVIVGGGPSGFSAAVLAKKAGADIILIERMNVLGGVGFQAGTYKLLASDVAVTEERALGGGDLFDVFENIALHKEINLPGRGLCSTYEITKLDSEMQKALREREIEFMLSTRVVDMQVSGDRVQCVVLHGGNTIEADVFIDATGAMRGTADCTKWGYGCVGCSLQCAVFGALGGMTEKKAETVALQSEYARTIGQWGSVGTAVVVAIGSLSEPVKTELNENGWIQVPVPDLIQPNLDRVRRTGQLEAEGYGKVEGFLGQHLTLLKIGNGMAKVTTIATPLYADSLRSFPGFEGALIINPIAGERGHSIHHTTITLRDNSLRVDGFDNLFSAGNKAAPGESLLDAMVIGEIAGHNAVRRGLRQPCLE